MKEIKNGAEDTILRRRSFESYARACACAVCGGGMAEEGAKYASEAEALLRRLKKPGEEDLLMLEKLEEMQKTDCSSAGRSL